MAQPQNRPQPFNTPPSGTTPGMTADNPQSDYARRTMQKPPDSTGGPMQGAQSVKPANQR